MTMLIYIFCKSCKREPEINRFCNKNQNKSNFRLRSTLTNRVNNQKKLSHYFGNIEENIDQSRIHLAVNTCLMFKDSI